MFDFAKVLSEHYEITKIKGYSQLKKFVGEEFIEKHFFYNIMERSFSTYKLFSGEKLKSLLKDGEPDYYMRKGNKIFLFEFKDILIDSKQNIQVIILELNRNYMNNSYYLQLIKVAENLKSIDNVKVLLNYYIQSKINYLRF